MISKCPKCKSKNVYFSKKKQVWICEDCKSEFSESNSQNLSRIINYSSSKFWIPELWNIAPTALALSYHQLHEYVAEENIGCTLFLIRDVFELMIKIPVTIIFNGLHELSTESGCLSAFLSSNAKASKLYEYSMQMLSTGKWWECVRLASSFDENVFSCTSMDDNQAKLYADTILYLKALHKNLYFKVPGKPKINMVTWRNRTLGHSCLADNPAEKYIEIPYILEMFKMVGELGVEYYKKVCLTDENKNPLRGTAPKRAEPEVYIQYIPDECGQAIYAEIHNFIAGRDNNLSCFDGFEKGKAYLLNYGNGERYRDQHLSEWLTNRHKTLAAVTASVALPDEDILADNLETKDINNLEEQLSVSDDIIGIKFLGRWLMDAVKSCKKGMLLLTAERGLGKSTFCSTIDPFDVLETIYDDEEYAEELEEFLGDVAVRIWHFNSVYRSRKDIFIPGIRDKLLTLEPENGNKVCGRLETQYNNLVSCPEDLRSLYFTECLNNTMREYRTRTDKQKLLLILDGIDEVSDIVELCSYMPDPVRLDEDICVLLTCRTKQEIKENKNLADYIESAQFHNHLDFTRDHLTITKAAGTETYSENVEYRDVVTHYIEAILREQGRNVTNEHVTKVAEAFEYRFSSLAAYRKLCRLSPKFYDKVGTNLFITFFHQVEINAPESYIRRLKWILNALVCAGEPITLRELAFLSGERYISYRLLGMMNDIQAFIKVTRSSRGNCYELSHSQWEDAVKTLVPHGDIHFRKQCTALMLEMEVFFNEDNIELILEETYAGELWLLKHILGIYNRNWKELKENWFEEIRIGSFETIIQLFLCSPSIINSYFGMSNIDEPYGILKNYSAALKTFGSDVAGLRGSKLDTLFVTNPILLSIPPIYSHLSEVASDIADKRSIAEKLGHSWHLLADATENESDKKVFREKSLDTYLNLINLLDPDSDMEQYGMCLYRIGRAHHLLGNISDASIYLAEFTRLLADYRGSYDIKEYLCRAYIRMGQIQKELGLFNEVFKYYENALFLSNKLVNDCKCITYLDTLAWSQRVMSHYYEDINDIEQAIAYREQSLATAASVLKISSKREYEEYRYRSLCKLGELYEKQGRFFDAKHVSEEALLLHRKGFSSNYQDLLARLSRISEAIGEVDRKIKYTSMLENEIERRRTLARAYTEVLAVLNSTNNDDVKKIPCEFMDFLKRNADPEYTYDVNFDEQLSKLSKKAQAVLAVIVTNFWQVKNGKAIEQYSKNEETHRLEKWAQLKHSMQKVPDYNVIAQKVINDNNRNTFCEVYRLLEYLPKAIITSISIDTLIWVKHRIGTTILVKDLDFNNLSIETLALLRYVLGDSLFFC